METLQSKIEQNLKNNFPAIKAAAQKVFETMAAVETIKPVVEKYKQEIIDKYGFKYSDEYRDYGDTITNPADYWMMGDDDSKIYYAECEKAKKENGFNLPEYHCPLLVAENEVRKAKDNLFETSKLLDLVPADDYDTIRFNQDSYNNYIEIILKLVASYKN